MFAHDRKIFKTNPPIQKSGDNFIYFPENIFHVTFNNSWMIWINHFRIDNNPKILQIYIIVLKLQNFILF